MKSLSRVRLLATPWTAAHQAPLSMGFSRQEYWSGLPLSSPGCARAFSSCGEQGLLSSCSTQAYHHSVSSCRAQALEHGLRNCGAGAQLPGGMWTLPSPGQKMRVQPLDGEAPLEKGMATNSSILAWIPWIEERGRLQSMGSQRVRHS